MNQFINNNVLIFGQQSKFYFPNSLLAATGLIFANPFLVTIM